MRTAEQWAMRITKLEAAHTRMPREELEEYVAHLRVQSADDVERRVLCALIIHPSKLEAADNLETDDFTTFQHKAIFEAIRNTQANGYPVCVEAIFAELEVVDLQRDMYLAQHCELPLLELLTTSSEYTVEGNFEADLRQLRNIQTRRRAA